MKHSLHWRNMKINIAQGVSYFSNTSFADRTSFTRFKEFASHSVTCILHIAMWVIQIKCRSWKRMKTLTGMHVPGTKLEGSLVQLVQILRFEGVCTNKKNLLLDSSAPSCFTFQIENSCSQQTNLFFKSGIARKF